MSATVRLTGIREVHGGRLLWRRAAQYRLAVRRSTAGRRLSTGRQRRAGGHWRVAGCRTRHAAASTHTADTAVYRRRHFVVVVDWSVAPAAGRFTRRFLAIVAGRVVVPRRRRLVRSSAVVVLLLVLFHLLPALSPPVLEPHLKHIITPMYNSHTSGYYNNIV